MGRDVCKDGATRLEITLYPEIPQAFSPYRMTYAAQMKGLKLPPPSANVRMQPYALYQYNNATTADQQRSSDHTFKVGGEVKWAVNTHSVLDLTFNTDFAQTEVDRAVNNLTRFNVFFPERRQFFLENSGVYAGADIDDIKPFFSRTIGLANSQFNASPVPIDAGIRYTNRTKDRTIAGLYVHQQGSSTQGAASFGVMRYLKNYGKQNNVGVMLTHRLDEEDRAIAFRERNNTTLSIDGFIRPDDSWTIQYLATASRDNSNDSIGFAGSFFAGRFLPKWYYGWVTKYVDEKYVPGMGFIFAQNTIHHSPGGYYIWRPKKLKWIRRQDPGFFVNYYHNATNGKIQQADIYLFPIYVYFQDNSFFQYSVTPTWQFIDFDFNVLGLPISQREYFYSRQRIDYNSDLSKKYSFTGSFEFGPYYNGKLQTTRVSIRVAPIPNIVLTGEYEYNDLRKVGEQRLNLKTSLITGGVRLAYNPNILASVFYQYNSFTEQGRWNVRGSWQFTPLSFVHVVFNDTMFDNSPVQNQSLICKISYMKQF